MEVGRREFSIEIFINGGGTQAQNTAWNPRFCRVVICM